MLARSSVFGGSSKSTKQPGLRSTSKAAKKSQDDDLQPFPTRVRRVGFKDGKMTFYLVNGTTVTCTLSKFPKLAAATPRQLRGYEILAGGIAWEALDEHLSIQSLLSVE